MYSIQMGQVGIFLSPRSATAFNHTRKSCMWNSKKINPPYNVELKGVVTRHFNYLKYVLRHKWFVFLASRRIGVSIWAAITHDLSKFRPSEWFPYAWTFYNSDGSKRYEEDRNFAWAWNDHQKRNKHHYQYWVILWDRGVYEPLEMPRKYILEMIADWMGAGRAITGKWEVKKWYEGNKDNIKLDAVTRRTVESILNNFL